MAAFGAHQIYLTLRDWFDATFSTVMVEDFLLQARQDFPMIYRCWKNSSYTGGCRMTLVP